MGSGTSRGWKAAIWPADRARRFLHLLLLCYVIKQVLIAIIMPPFTGHDEVAHFQYIRDVAEDFHIPRIPDLNKWRADHTPEDPTVDGDFLDPDLYRWADFVLDWLQQGTINPFSNDTITRIPIYAVQYPDYHLPTGSAWVTWPNGWVYTANHPPLFYILSAPVYLATNWMSVPNQMILLRMVAIPFGVLAVLGTYLMARWLFPRASFIAIVAAAFVAFQPQISYEAAMINNDILVIGFGAMLMAFLVLGMRTRFSWRLTALIGVLFGLMLLSKGSSIAFAAPIALLMPAGIGWRRWREWIPKGAAVAALGFGLSAPWYIFLYRTYGNFSALPQVADLQYWETYSQGTALPSLWHDLIWNRAFAVSRWEETWGDFGWRKIPPTSTLLWIIGIPLLVLIVIFFLSFLVSARPGARRYRDGSPEHPYGWQLWTLVVFVIVGIIGYAAVIQFGMTFVLTQARYFFPMVPPVAVLLAMGLHALTPPKARGYVQVGSIALLVALNFYIYSAYVLPYWYDGFWLKH